MFPKAYPAFESGLSVDDEIIAVGEFRVRADQLVQRLDSYRPGDRISIYRPARKTDPP